MFKLDSEKALFDAFRPRDRKLVEAPPDVAFPLFVHQYLSWTHPAGGRVFLVFATPDGAPTGIAFDTNGSGLSVPAMCNWCHCSASGTQVGLLSARVNSSKTVGVYVCMDLRCKDRLEELANRSGRSVVPSLRALVERMGQFASEALKIDLSGSGR